MKSIQTLKSNMGAPGNIDSPRSNAALQVVVFELSKAGYRHERICAELNLTYNQVAAMITFVKKAIALYPELKKKKLLNLTP